MDIFAPSILVSILFLIGGTLLLYFGAEGLVTGSSSMAFRMKVTPLVVGLTIVAFGTSSPELVVSISAALKGNSPMAIGNVIGSNICNIALILGISALIRPIKVNVKVIQTDITLMIAATILLIILMLDNKIQRIDGVILTIGIILYNILTIYFAKRGNAKQVNEDLDDLKKKIKRKSWIDILLIVGGLGILVLGADLFVEGASRIAKVLGASNALIGLSLVALGTSLPELATSVVAAIKDEGDISIGNAIGSNLFNILAILGFASLVHPISADGINQIDIGVLMFVTVIIFPLARIGLTLNRVKGALLVLIYIGYMYYLYTYQLH